MAFEKKVWLGGDTVTAAHLNRIENGIVEAMGSGGSGAGEAVLPDWNENDPTSAAYIQNRPFYKSGSATVLYQNSAFSLSELTGPTFERSVGTDLNAEIPDGLYDGMPVTVTVDGESEELTFAYYSNSTPACYGAGQPSQNRFGIVFYPVDSATSGQSYGRGFELCDFQNKTSRTVNVSVVSGSVNVVKIPAEYLDIPDGVVVAGEGTGSTVQGLIGNATAANNNTATGDYAHVEGGNVDTNSQTGEKTYYPNTASGVASHAEGQSTTASGSQSHAEGENTTASGDQSHAEGYYTTASGSQSHAEGASTTASGPMSHAEGQNTTASGQASHAEGSETIASGSSSHAEGYGTTASGALSHAEGKGTISNHAYQHVFGQYNIPDPSTAEAYSSGTYIEIVGNGTSDGITESRSNARTLDWNGNETLAGSLTLGKGTADEVTVTASQLARLLDILQDVNPVG